VNSVFPFKKPGSLIFAGGDYNGLRDSVEMTPLRAFDYRTPMANQIDLVWTDYRAAPLVYSAVLTPLVSDHAAMQLATYNYRYF
jgi:hypothetical protein